MPQEPLGYLDYLSEAFHASPPVKGMGPVPVNKVFLAGAFILGFANPGFWALAAALEIIYLYFLSTHPAFQKYVQAKRMKIVDASRAEKINSMILSLDPASKKRLNALNANLNEITRLMNIDSDSATSFLRETKQRTLQQLSDVFLRMMFSKRVINDSLQNTDVDKIKREAKEIEMQLQKPGINEALARSHKANLEIQVRRITNIEKANENLDLVEAELKRIENQVHLIREEVAINRSPEALSSTLDRIGNTLTETEDWMNRHSDFFSKVAGSGEELPIPLPTPSVQFDSSDDSGTEPPPQTPVSQ